MQVGPKLEGVGGGDGDGYGFLMEKNMTGSL